MSDTTTTETFEEEMELDTAPLVNKIVAATAVGCLAIGSVIGWYGNNWIAKRKANKLAKKNAAAVTAAG